MNFSRVKTFSPMSFAYASQFMEGVSKAMQLNRKDVLLDVGCGVGSLTTLLAKHVARVTAFDISPEMIKEAKEISKAKNITYSVGDATKLSTYQEYRNSFDKVVAHLALHWMKDYKTALEGIYQSLKPGGQCFMDMTQKNPNVLDIAIVLNSYTSPKWEAFMKGYEPAYYPFKGSIDDYKQMLTSIGFKDIECTQEIARYPFTYEEAKDYYPNFMGQLGRIPEDRRDEYVEEVLKYLWDTGPRDDKRYLVTGTLIFAVVRK